MMDKFRDPIIRIKSKIRSNEEVFTFSTLLLSLLAIFLMVISFSLHSGYKTGLAQVFTIPDRPGTIIRQAEIDTFLAQRTTNSIYNQVYNAVIVDADAALNATPKPPDGIFDTEDPYDPPGSEIYDPDADRHNYTDGVSDSNKVRNLALAYRFTGDIRYRDKVRQFINAWNTGMAQGFTHAPQEQLEVSLVMPGFILGASLIDEMSTLSPLFDRVTNQVFADGLASGFQLTVSTMCAAYHMTVGQTRCIDDMEHWFKQHMNTDTFSDGSTEQAHIRFRSHWYNDVETSLWIRAAYLLDRNGRVGWNYVGTPNGVTLRRVIDFAANYALHPGDWVNWCILNDKEPCDIESLDVPYSAYQLVAISLANNHYQDPDYASVVSQYSRTRDDFRFFGRAVVFLGGSTINATPAPTGILTPTPRPVTSTPTPTPPSGSCQTSSTTIRGFSMASQTGSFTVEFDARPSQNNTDSLVGLSRGVASSYTSFANIVRFNTTGTIDARNGNTYSAATSIPYSAGTNYHFKLEVNIPTHRYTAYVTPSGQTQRTIGTNYNFRTEQAGVTFLDRWNILSLSGGTIQVCNFTLTGGGITPTSTPQPTSQPTATPTPTSGTNIIVNGSFESGTSPWILYTNGTGSFVTTSSNVYSGTLSAQVNITTAGSNIQFYQRNLTLNSGIRYRLQFAAKSNTGHDMYVSVFKHGSPYTNYGVSSRLINLTNAWQPFTIDFTATSFSGTVSDARLMFYLPLHARAGDVYYFDSVSVTRI